MAFPLPCPAAERALPMLLRLVILWSLFIARPAAAAPGSPAAPPKSEDAPTTRIVSLVPNLTELLFALDAGPQVVGVSDFCMYPAEARTRPHVGGLINPGLEATLRLRPTIVLLYRSQADFAARLQTLNVPSQSFTVDRLADLYDAIERLGQLTGHTAPATSLTAEIRTSLAATATRAGQRTGPRPRGIIIVSRDPSSLRNIYQAAQDNFLGELFQLAGGQLAIPNGAPLTKEAIIRANPDIIIDLSAAATDLDHTPAPQKQLGPWATLTTLPAVKNNQVYTWPASHPQLLGPGVTQTAQTFATLIDSIP